MKALKELLKTLRDSVKEKDVDSFHCQLEDLERVVQNNERMRQLLEEAVLLCLAAHMGSTPVVETLIQKGVGEKKIYYSKRYGLKLGHAKLFSCSWT